MTAIAILIGFIAAGLVVFGPRISDAIRARKQADAADEAEAAEHWARINKPAPRTTIPAQRPSKEGQR